MSQKVTDGLSRELTLLDIIIRLNNIILVLIPVADLKKINIEEVNKMAAEAQRCRDAVAQISAALAHLISLPFYLLASL